MAVISMKKLLEVGVHFGHQTKRWNPKMAPYIITMRENVARVLHCDITQVNIKATRGEKLGFVGRKEGIVSQSVVLLNKKG